MKSNQHSTCRSPVSRSLELVFSALLAWILMVAFCTAQSVAHLLQGKTVAVVVVPQNETAKAGVRTAQSRLEQVLADNAIDVLDQEKMRELKDVFRTLEDPGAFVTAETFVENAQRFAIHGLLAVYLSADVVPGIADYFAATANADIRFIDQQTARVRAFTTPPMGTRGVPASDGLTANSAVINAVQRSVDATSELLDLQLMEFATVRSVTLQLRETGRLQLDRAMFAPPENNQALWHLAKLENETWRNEEVTATTQSVCGGLGAIGGYIRDTDFRRRPPRLFGSRVHVIDLQHRTPINIFECSPVAMRTREERHSSQVVDLAFIRNWRYLAAVTGNHLLFWDIETGTLLGQKNLPAKAESLLTIPGDDQQAWQIVVQTRRGAHGYAIERAGR